MKLQHIALVAALALVGLTAACQSTPAAPIAPASAVKLLVAADGVYEASSAALKAAGFDLTGVSAAALSLTTGGQPVGFTLVEQGQGQALRFYGQAPAAMADSDRRVYWLARRQDGQPAAVTISGRAVRPAEPTPTATSVVSVTVHVEEQRQYDIQAAAGQDRWLWDTLFAPAEKKITAPVDQPAAPAGDAAALLRVRLVAASFDPKLNPDHHLALAVNGTAVADERWDGAGEHIITATLPAGVLRNGANEVTLSAPGDTGAAADSVTLDWLELTYGRELRPTASLEFSGASAGYALAATAAPAVLWDITEPARPVMLTGYAVKDGLVEFDAGPGLRRFIVATQAGLRSPEIVRPAETNLREWPGGADMIIVTAPQFRETLKPLIEARQSQGLRVAVVDIAQVYDAFSFGEPGPGAIRSLVQQAATHWTPPAPRFLLLVGDASNDPRGYRGGAEVNLVPTQEINTDHSGWTASDVWFALPDDSPTAEPVLAVGRFPAQTVEQVQAMVAKTLRYAAGNPPRTALLVADNDEPGFAAVAQEFASALAGYTSQVITVAGDGAAARQALLQAFDQGAGLISYFGHGSVRLWAKEKVFSVEDVKTLTNRDRLPLVFTATCLSGLFQDPDTPSLGETLVRADNGGAAAALVPSSADVLPDQRVLALALAAAFAQTGADAPQTLGEAVLQAQRAISAAPGSVRQVLLTFNILGDPSMSLGR